MTCDLTLLTESNTCSVTVPCFKLLTPDFEAHRILRITEVCCLLGISKSMLYLYLDPKSKYYKPDLPKSFKISARAVGWKAGDIYTYINQLHMKRGAHE